MRSRIGMCLVMTLAFMATGCGLTEPTRLDAEKVAGELDEARQYVAESESGYQSLLTSSELPNVSAIAERENLAQHTEAANAYISTAGSCSNDVTNFLTANRRSDEEAVVVRVAECRGLFRKGKESSKKPVAIVHEWERLFKEVPTELAGAEDSARYANTRISTELQSPAGELGARLRMQQTRYPNKDGDLVDRISDVLGAQRKMNSDLGVVRAQARAAKGEGSFDVAAFQTAVIGVDEASDTIDLGLDDLDGKLDELDETWSVTLVRLERTPDFQVNRIVYEWCQSCDYGGEERKDQGWSRVNEADWFQINPDVEKPVAESKGWGQRNWSETFIEDKQIVYTCHATTVAEADGVRSAPERAKIDAETCWDYVELVAKMEAFFEGKVITSRNAESDTKDSEDGQPTMLDWTTMLVLEQKLKGQYEDDYSESPSPDGIPAGYVGNEEYGQWRDDGHGRRQWHWNEFMVGYLWGSAMHRPIYYGGWYGGYHDYRVRSGYGRGYATNGSYKSSSRYSSGSYRTAAASSRGKSGTGSVRGAGGASRSRGMGGGGK